MSEFYPPVVKTVAQINKQTRSCEALSCTSRENVEPVSGPGDVTLTLCPDHRSKLFGGDVADV